MSSPKKLEKEGWKSQYYKGHDFEYVGSGVIFKCLKCKTVEDLFNAVSLIKKCGINGKKRR